MGSPSKLSEFYYVSVFLKWTSIFTEKKGYQNKQKIAQTLLKWLFWTSIKLNIMQNITSVFVSILKGTPRTSYIWFLNKRKPPLIIHYGNNEKHISLRCAFSELSSHFLLSSEGFCFKGVLFTLSQSFPLGPLIMLEANLFFINNVWDAIINRRCLWLLVIEFGLLIHTGLAQVCLDIVKMDGKNQASLMYVINYMNLK